MDTKKRVLFFIPEFPVLSETFIEREIACIDRRGNLNVDILSLSKSSGSLSVNLREKTHYKRIDISSIIGGLLLAVFRPTRVFRAFFVVLGNRNRSTLANFYIFVKSIAYSDIVLQFGPDLILCHFLSEPSTIMLAVSIITDVPFAISAHARDVFGKNQDPRLNAELVRIKASKAKFIVLCNRKAYEKCKEYVAEIDIKKLHLNYHGLDFERLKTYIPESANRNEVTHIYSIGRLVKKKGFEYLIEASKILKERGIDHLVRVAGPGPMYDELTHLIEKYDLKATFTILGGGMGISNSEAMEELAKSDIFVLPSIETDDGDAEGIPNTILEASYFKKPVISTYSGSIPEFLVDKKNGILVAQKDPHQLADAIENLMKDKTLATSLANKANSDLVTFFDLSKNVVKLENLIISSL